MKTIATFALMLAAPAALAQDDAPKAPKTGTVKLHPVYMTKDQTAFIDVALLTRSGDVVEGWGLNVYSKPIELAPGKVTDVHWTRFRMACSSKSVTVTWVLGRDLITTTFAIPMNAQVTVTPKSGWDLTYYHGCKNETVFTAAPQTSEQVAVALARGEMKRKP